MDKKSIARKIIEKLAPTAEEAVKLTGKERKAYLGALDTVHGSQAERAKALGFGDETYYHGTDADIHKFDSSKSRTGQLYGRGNYVTKDADEAGVYTQILDQHSGTPEPDLSGSIYPLKVRKGTEFDVVGGFKDPAVSEKLKTLVDPAVAKNIDASPDNYNMISTVQGSVDPTKFSKTLKDSGYDSVKVDRDVSNIINSKDLRSTNAAFDPRFKDSGLILAANGSKKPSLGLDSATQTLGAAYNKVTKPVSDLRQRILEKIAAATDISNGKETVSKGTREEILNLAAPDVMDAVPVGKIGKLMGAAPIVARIMSKEGKILGAAEKAAPVLAREVKAGESTAEALAKAPESIFGKTVIKDTGPKVTSGTLQIKDNILKRLLPKNPMGSGI